MLISVIVPVYREEEVIADFYKALNTVMVGLPYDYEIIFVDDQRDTKCLAELVKISEQNSKVKILCLSKNFGHQVALTAGIDIALGDAVVMLDGDLQHPPELIPTLIENWQNGYDVVYTIRQNVRGVSWLKKYTSNLFYKIMRSITDVDMDLSCADFRLMSRKAVEGFKQIRENGRFIRGLVAWMGYKQIGIPFIGQERYKGESKYTLKKLFRFAISGILSFSVFPVRLITAIGLIVSLLSLLYIVRIIYFMLFSDLPMPDWLPITTLILFISGIQMLMVGVLGEYIAEIFNESKRRPLYLIDQVYQKKGD